MKNAGNWILLIIILVLIGGGVILALPNKSQGPDSTNTEENDNVVADETLIYRDGAAHIGKEDAKVKIVVFSDYLCPYCKVLHDTIKSIIAAHPDEVVMYHRAFIIHNDAIIMAKAVEAANKQGKFEQADDAIFETYTTGDQATMNKMAELIGLNIETFNKDLLGSEIQSIIDKDNSDARALKLPGTPSVFLNGEYLSDPKKLESKINELLK